MKTKRNPFDRSSSVICHPAADEKALEKKNPEKFPTLVGTGSRQQHISHGGDTSVGENRVVTQGWKLLGGKVPVAISRIPHKYNQVKFQSTPV